MIILILASMCQILVSPQRYIFVSDIWLDFCIPHFTKEYKPHRNLTSLHAEIFFIHAFPTQLG